MKDLPSVDHFDSNVLKQFMEGGKTLIDLRDASSFGGAHVPGSINIGLSPQVANWLGRWWSLKEIWRSSGIRKVTSMKHSCSLEIRL